MLGVLVDRRAIVVAVVLTGLSGGAAFANEGSDAAVALRGPNMEAAAVSGPTAAPARVPVRLAASQIVATADSATEGDEVPGPAPARKTKSPAASQQAEFVGGDEVPAVSASPARPVPQAVPASGGDEVPPSVAAPAATAQPKPAAAESKPAAAESKPAAVQAKPVARDAAPAAEDSKPEATEETETAPDAAPTPAAAAVAAPAVPVVTDANTPIAAQLRDLAGGKFDRMLGGDKQRMALDAFYAKRNYAPVWITDGAVNDGARAAVDYLANVDADGLNPADYPVPDLASMKDPASLAEGELKLSAAVTTYAHHAQMGRVHWTRVSGDIFYEPKPSAPAEVLTSLADAGDVAAVLAGYEPQAAGYLALKAKLAELRGGGGTTTGSIGKIPAGPALKVGMEDGRVDLLRQRLGVDGDGQVFDKTLSDAVKRFQQGNNLKPSGVADAATVDALNGRHSGGHLTDLILVNMERWRWVPHDLGKTYVLVNLPDFMLYVYQNGRQVWSTRIVDGKPDTPTPIMSVDMKSITINPTWNVPDSIAAKEYVPMMRQDSTILERMGLTVTYNQNGTIHISQPPGPQNALGQLRFNLPNKFLVYQHDSNEKYLFSRPVRDTSHGCMRIENPVKYAEVLLSITRPREGYSEDRIRGLFGNREQEIRLPTFMPVHVTYQTAFVDKDGKLQTRDDMYGRDRVLLAILKGDERKVADIPIERHDNAVRREALAVPDQMWGGGGQNIFSRLFGFSSQPQPQARTATTAGRVR
jgi:murein L,D-transpeptidase YcbB/YkuD